MAFGAEAAVGLLTSALYDVFRTGLVVLRRRRAGWSRAVVGGVERRGVTLGASERRRLVRWLETWDVDTLAVTSGEARSVLVGVLSNQVFAAPSPSGEGREDEADRLAGALWAALAEVLDSAEQREVRRAVAARHGELTTASVLEELGWVREATADLARLLSAGLPVERAWLRPVPGVAVSPYQLLWARSGVVPFDDRGGWLDGLAQWCAGGERVSVRVVAGTGGMGKTRLALQLCRRMAAQGWLTGFYRPSGDMALEALAAQRAPRLVVVDYADTNVDVVRRLIARLVDRLPSRSCRIRVLLLVRRLGEATDPRRWFTGPFDRVSQVVDAAEVLSLSTVGADKAAVEGVEFPVAARRRLFDAASVAFAPYIAGAVRGGVPDLDETAFGSPLVVSMAALLSVDPDAVLPSTGGLDALIDRVLEREQRRHWIESPLASEARQRKAVAIATLFGADDEREAIDLMATTLSHGPSPTAVDVVDWLHGLYEGPRWLNPLEPDLLGEYLVSRCLDDALLDRAVHPPAPSTTSASSARALTVLARVAAARAELRPRIAAAVGPTLTSLAEAALALEDPDASDQIVGPLTSLVRQLDVADAADITDVALWDRPFGLAGVRLAEAVGRQAIAGARRRIAAGAGHAAEAELAWACSRLGVWLLQLGHDDEARSITEESIETYLRLADADRSQLARLARAVNLLGMVHHRQGDLTTCLALNDHVFDIYWQLTAEAPDQHLAYLAVTLSNRAEYLWEVGRYDEGVNHADVALGIIRAITAVTAEAEMYLPMRLHALSLPLGGAGRHAESLAAVDEALTHRRRQAAASPAHGRHSLATMLNERSVELAALGRHDESLQAIAEASALARHLAATSPGGLRLRTFAITLNNLAAALGDDGQHDDALAVAHEAVAVARPMAERAPAANRAVLAAALNNLAAALADTGHHTDAIDAVAEAIDLYRRLAHDHPTVHTDDLDAALHNEAIIRQAAP